MLGFIIQNMTSALILPWNRFWFKPISTRPLGVFRIFFGLLLIQNALLLIPDLFVWLGKDGVVSAATFNAWTPGVRLNILNLYPDSDLWLSIVFLTFFIATIFFTVGFFTRISTIVIFLCLISFHGRNYLIINSGDTLMRLLSLWLIFSPAGKSFSVDQQLENIKQRKQGTLNQQKNEAEPWAQRLMQINITLVYAQTFFKKIVGTVWQNGTAVYFSSHFTEMHHLPTYYIFDHMWTIQLLTWSTLAIEFSLGFLIWFRPIRYYIILLGVVMHLTIDWSMLIPQFQWLMIFGYILFIEPDDLDRLFSWISEHFFPALVKKIRFG
jgi:hypothetical protein